MLLGDCLATTVMHKRKFSKEKFKVFHPGGNIGSSLLLAKDIMITGKKMPVIDFKKKLSDALRVMTQKKLGIVVVLQNKSIAGLFTDGDLRREMKYFSKNTFLKEIMTKKPIVINENMPASKTLAIMNEKMITSILVVSDNDFKKKHGLRLKGVIEIHSLLKHGLK